MRMTKLDFCCCFLLLLLSVKDVAAAPRNAPTNANEEAAYSTNLRHRNGSQEQFHQHVASKDEKVGNSDCSVDILRNGMPPYDVKRSAVAVALSSLVYDFKDSPEADEEPAYDRLFDGQTMRGVYYQSGIDAVYTVRIRNEFCVAAFRGTEVKQDDFTQDIGTNWDSDPIEFEKEDASKNERKGGNDALCDMHSGYHDAYFNFEYRLSVEAFLQACSEECPECDVVLTGHSQGGGIAEIAALYYKKAMESTPENLYIITFGATQALGAGCSPLFSKEERCRIFRYIMASSGSLGNRLLYDPFPMLFPRALGDLNNDGIFDPSSSSDTFARHGGLAFLGHELFLNADDPSALTLGGFDGHHIVETSKYDLRTISHRKSMYMAVLEAQNQILSSTNNECYLPTNGFSIGSLCNTDESDFHCIKGFSECKRNGWWPWSENTCQIVGDSSSQSMATHPFCQKITLP